MCKNLKKEQKESLELIQDLVENLKENMENKVMSERASMKLLFFMTNVCSFFVISKKKNKMMNDDSDDKSSAPDDHQTDWIKPDHKFDPPMVLDAFYRFTTADAIYCEFFSMFFS